MTSLSDQSAVLEAAARLAREHPDLPGGYIRVHSVGPRVLDISLHDNGALAAFAAWREVLGLGVPVYKSHDGSHWLTVSGLYGGVTVALTVHAPEADLRDYLARIAPAAVTS